MPEKEKPIDKEDGLIPESELEETMEKYGFSKNEYTVLPLINIDNNIIASNRLSKTAKKAFIISEDKKYVLKEFPWYIDDKKTIEFISTYQDSMDQKGLKVPSVYRNGEGGIITNTNGKYFYLQEFIDSSNDSEIGDFYFSSGKNLAKLHRKGACLESLEEYREISESALDSSRGILEILEDISSQNRDRIEKTNMEKIEEFLQKSREKLESVEKKYSQIKRELTPIHGDYNPSNLIIEDKYVKGIVDFDNACFGKKERDLVEGILTHSFINYKKHTSTFGKLPDKFNKEIASKFLEGYLTEFNRKEINTREITDITEAVMIELAGLGLIRGDYPFHSTEYLMDSVNKAKKEIYDLIGG